MTEITNLRAEANTVDAPPVADAMVAALLARVGERVRKARERKGVPRRVLADLSGVSQRYLAQIEAGEGNISIALLLRVAIALVCRIEQLTEEDDPWTSDAERVADLYRRADAKVRARVLAELNPARPETKKADRIALIGLRGAGKSTLGALLGPALGLPFLELNRDIEDEAGISVADVIALYGPEGYRRLERQALERLVARHEAAVLAVAGGIVGEPETYRTLLENFHTVWIRARPEEHMDRVRAQGDTRPMAGYPEAMQQLRAILSDREALYQRADAELDTSGAALETSSAALVQLVKQRGWGKSR